VDEDGLGGVSVALLKLRGDGTYLAWLEVGDVVERVDAGEIDGRDRGRFLYRGEHMGCIGLGAKKDMRLMWFGGKSTHLEAHRVREHVGASNGHLQTVGITAVGQEADAVAELELGHTGTKALDDTRGLIAERVLVLGHDAHGDSNVLLSLSAAAL
jgi:hypothetical protein